MCNSEDESSSPSSSSGSSDESSCWTNVLLAETNLLRGFALAILLAFVLILLFSFYLLYVRLRRLHRLTASSSALSTEHAELGLKKEVREMLPVIVYKESFSVTDSLCSVCLCEYEAEDRLQQIPSCSHTFHKQCIDHWLSKHTTCPLCRLSLLPPPPTQPQVTGNTMPIDVETSRMPSLHI